MRLETPAGGKLLLYEDIDPGRTEFVTCRNLYRSFTFSVFVFPAVNPFSVNLVGLGCSITPRNRFCVFPAENPFSFNWCGGYCCGSDDGDDDDGRDAFDDDPFDGGDGDSPAGGDGGSPAGDGGREPFDDDSGEPGVFFKRGCSFRILSSWDFVSVGFGRGYGLRFLAFLESFLACARSSLLSISALLIDLSEVYSPEY